MTGPVDAERLARARVQGDAAQRLFATLMWALAEPGTVRRLPPDVVEAEHRRAGRPLCPAVWLALGLADTDVSVSVDDPDAARLVTATTRAPLGPLSAAWLVVLDRPSAAQLCQVQIGDAAHPERGARVGITVGALGAGGSSDAALRAGDRALPDVQLILWGPGVDGTRQLAVQGLDTEVARCLGRASGPYPVGFDTWLFSPDGLVAAVPRSTWVTVLPTVDDEG